MSYHCETLERMRDICKTFCGLRKHDDKEDIDFVSPLCDLNIEIMCCNERGIFLLGGKESVE